MKNDFFSFIESKFFFLQKCFNQSYLQFLLQV